jgi:[protein-PII] uridylyltransferase
MLSPPGERDTLLERLSPKLVPELKRYVATHRGSVEETVASGGADAGLPAGHRYSKIVDGLLSSLFHATTVAMGNGRSLPPVALGAVGSYGRRTLSLYSDLDVRLVCDADLNAVRPMAEALLYPLWDAGLTIGHQVILPDDTLELARTDLPTATSLLDFRLIAGEPRLSEVLMHRAYQGPFGDGGLRDFLERLEKGASERHERFGGSIFLLEPDVKNGTGGLRDLDVALWAARARWRVTDFKDMVRVGALVVREWREIDLAWRFLMRIRNCLHLQAGRRADRLSFEQQERIARLFGYEAGGPGVEAFMSDYYRHARAVERASEMVVSRAAPPPRRKPREEYIGGGLKLTNSQVSLVESIVLEEDPTLALRLYAVAVERDLPVYDFARQAVSRACGSARFCRRLRESEPARRLFVRLVKTIQLTKFKGGSVLRELHEVGLLLAMIPEFAPVVGRVHHDIYHVYTVDVHSVAAVDRLRALCRGDLGAEQPLACRLAADMARPNVVFFATLLHDIGKDLGGRNHCDRGRDMCRPILERLGISETEIVEVQHLVEKHLRMYHVATRRDIDDVQTLREFCAEVHGHEGLSELFLLTVSDVSTTSPTAMTSWKARMLNELYVAAERWLSDGDASRGARAKEVLREVKAHVPSGTDPTFIDAVVESLPPRYLYANETAAVVKHIGLIEEARKKSPIIRHIDTNEPYVEIGVIADDRPGLLSYIAATLSASKVRVLAAQVYSWQLGDQQKRALDLFWVRAGTESENAVRLVPKLEALLEKVLKGEIDPIELVRGKKDSMRWSFRAAPAVETEIFVDNRSATQHTVVEVITQDRRDLLFWLSTALHQEELTIDLAKINTEGERIADVFYVTNQDGSKLEPEQVDRVKARIHSVLAMIEGDSET